MDQAEKIKTFGIRNESSDQDPFTQAYGDRSNIQGNSAYESPPLRSKERALVVDGRTLTFILDQRANLLTKFLSLTRHCSAVLGCRATPLQKVSI